MSGVVTVQRSVSARSSLMYAVMGRGKQYFDNVNHGTNRVAACACSMDSLNDFVEHCEAQAFLRGRKNECYNIVLAVDPDVLDVHKKSDIETMLRLGVDFVERAFDAEYAVVVHDDAKGGHAHAHIYVANHDNLTGRALKQNTSWYQLRHITDEVVADAGFVPNPDPLIRKPEWEKRREEFEAGSYDQLLGDRISEALHEPTTVDWVSFESALNTRGVRIMRPGEKKSSRKTTDSDRTEKAREINPDRWTYSMRRLDNGNWGRRKPSRLSSEFMFDRVEEVFAENARRRSHSVSRDDDTLRQILENVEAATRSRIDADLNKWRSELNQSKTVDTPVVGASPSRGSVSSHQGGRVEGSSSPRVSTRPPVSHPPVSQPVVTVTLTRGQMLLDLPWAWGDFLDQAPQHVQDGFVDYVNGRCAGVRSASEVDMPVIFERFLCDHPEVESAYDRHGNTLYMVYARENVLRGRAPVRDKAVYLNETLRDKQRREAVALSPAAQQVLRDVRRDMRVFHSEGSFDRAK